ncbi:Uncharacterized protein C8034_v000376 [Colletotrichum sidae]|uniref:Uncharacterized protein n=2 Tax=Colletotrichum orbiculare species complex TaxID=2707354 RepID=N4VQ53_COLOR|nr:Uncharacterized protein Cob_v009719 [Colletotrichum orbiculare MAFF 240422]TEA07958.1 Uncharacterized protein C8034_v000376 [Colletotrichum sidae]
MTNYSNLDLIEQVDSYPYTQNTQYTATDSPIYTFIWEDDKGKVPLGYVPSRVLKKLIDAPVSVRGKIQVDTEERTVSAFYSSTIEGRSKRAANLFDYWREKDTFPILRGWRDELWPVYGRDGELLYNMERTACGLFGVTRYGVHLTAYVRCPTASHGIMMWVPRRSPTKSTFPGMLDNTVAGGLMTGEDPLECVIREADEEADLPAEVIRTRIKHVGGVTYIYITEAEAGQVGLIYPEVQWIYDLELSEDVVPQPNDGEVADFSLCTVEEVQQGLAQGKFKPNCALVTLDFMIRHGIVTEHNEPNYHRILRRIHRQLPFPGPHNRFPEYLNSQAH